MITVTIPSIGRAGALPGLGYFTTAVYVVPESQVDAYASAGVPRRRLVSIPDASDGNIARKRNWILANFPRPLVMIDDDVDAIGYFERTGQKDGDHAPKRMEPADVMPWLERGFELAEGFDVPVWGVAQNPDNRIFKEWAPFNLTEPILGPFQAHRAHELRFDERMGTKDDYDFALQALNRHRKILRINKFHYVCSHGTNRGGIVASRSRDVEEGYCKAIMRKWGADVIAYRLPPKRLQDLLNGRVRVPIQGI